LNFFVKLYAMQFGDRQDVSIKGSGRVSM
jgi:hypothetical protein